MYSHLDIDPDEEELLEYNVFLANDEESASPWYIGPGGSTTPSKAFKNENPFRPKWIEAKDLELTRLASYDCWRKLDASEEIMWKKG